MVNSAAAVVLALAASASAHFTLLYPEWRASSFRAPASQWIYPCAGLNSTADSPRTLWPLTGGAIAYNNSHDHVYAIVNLGLGDNAQRFNFSLVDNALVNVTGAGVLCLPNLTLPSGLQITEGTNASIQVINLSTSGASLYNCADITFSASAPTVNSSVCANSTGVTAAALGATSTSHSHDATTNTSSAANTSASAKSGASSGYGSSAVSTVVVGVAALVMSYFL